jgi:hypothetical protein
MHHARAVSRCAKNCSKRYSSFLCPGFDVNELKVCEHSLVLLFCSPFVDNYFFFETLWYDNSKYFLNDFSNVSFDGLTTQTQYIAP